MQKCKKERKKDKYEFMRTRIFILFLFIGGGGDGKKGISLDHIGKRDVFFCFFLFFFLFFSCFFSHEDRCKASNVAMAVKPIPVIRVSVQGVESLWGDCRFIPADWGS